MPEAKDPQKDSPENFRKDLSRFLPEGRSLHDFPEDLVEEQKSILYATGEVIGKFYEVVEELGFGNVGAVYRVKDHLMHAQEMALKVILPSLVRSLKVRERFIAGIQKAHSLRHDGIVTVIDVRADREKDVLFFTMELLPGENLASYLKAKGGKLHFTETCELVLQICDALRYAHGEGAIHRDIKPQNIFVLPNGTVKVLDFGLAKLLSPGRLTCSSMGLGTAYYVAPEQSMGREVDERSDIFSLGTVFYQMLAGQVPMGIFQFPSDINPEVPSSINPVIEKCLHQNPEDRFRDAASLAKDIRKVLNEYTRERNISRLGRLKEEVIPKRETGKINEVRRKRGVSAVVILGLFLIIASIYFLNNQDLPVYESDSHAGDVEKETGIPESLLPRSVYIPLQPADEDAGKMTETLAPDAETDPPGLVEPRVAEGGTSEAVHNTKTDDTTAPLLEVAEEQMKRKRYTTPEDDNAFDTLTAVLEMSPDNRRAAEMIDRIRDTYVDLGNKALTGESYAKAGRYYQKALSVSPEDESVIALLGGARKKQREMIEKRNSAAGELVLVKGGCFQMGDITDDGVDDERPLHEACVDDFYLGKYEVTQGQWVEVMEDNPSLYPLCGKNCPVERVSYNDVQEFIRRLNRKTGFRYRLPTEAEWEYACRSGGKRQKYSGSSDAGGVAWYQANSGGKTHAGGQKQANGLGVYDMSGNVWEWVADWFDRRYYANSPTQNPTGPESGTFRVKRGGSWSFEPDSLRCSYRALGTPDYRYKGDGFRLARSK